MNGGIRPAVINSWVPSRAALDMPKMNISPVGNRFPFPSHGQALYRHGAWENGDETSGSIKKTRGGSTGHTERGCVLCVWACFIGVTCREPLCCLRVGVCPCTVYTASRQTHQIHQRTRCMCNLVTATKMGVPSC